MRFNTGLVIACALAVCGADVAAGAKPEYRVGVGRVDITPEGPIWMSGYASRIKPSEGALTKLYAKALAIEDSRRGKVVIVTTDLIGLPRQITDEVAARAQKQWGLERSRLLFNSSHTHTGPVVRPNLNTMYNLTTEQTAVLSKYADKLREDLYTVIGAALKEMQPASLEFGQSTAGFAINRREFTRQTVRIGLNPGGPVDHAVPTIAVRSADGKLKAVLYGYACHNTTLTGEHYKISGDYAAYSQAEIESAHPGATALFVLLCGGDQNPNPRSSEEIAMAHGKTLAGAVKQTLEGKMEAVKGPIRTAFQVTDLAFAPHTREQFEREATEGNQYQKRRAQEMLKLYDERRPIRSTPYPVQAVRFGSAFTMVALGGEVVVDYALRAKKEYPKERLIVAGYSNDVMCYIPSKRVLKEGGYEAETSMIYYGMPGKFSEEVEETIFGTIGKVMQRVGVKK
jgi:neutral ceramidase